MNQLYYKFYSTDISKANCHYYSIFIQLIKYLIVTLWTIQRTQKHKFRYTLTMAQSTEKKHNMTLNKTLDQVHPKSRHIHLPRRELPTELSIHTEYSGDIRLNK